MAVQFRVNTASDPEIADHLLQCDANFTPPLSTRVDIGSYACKLATKAVRFEAWVDSVLIGLLAIYCNDTQHKTAFVTSVSLLVGWQGKGIAVQLLTRCIDYVKNQGFAVIELEVNCQNQSALRLYQQSGFQTKTTNGDTAIMQLIFNQDA